MAAAAPIELKFATALLRKLGKPITATAVKNLVGWFRAEGGHTHNNARFNFLNTTQPAPGAGNTGSQGNIKVYRSFDQGVDATAQTLRNGRYGAILSSLNADPNTFAVAVNSTPWGTKSNFSSISRSIAVGGLPAGQQAAAKPANRPAPGAAPSSSVAPGGIQLGGPEGQKLLALLQTTSAGALRGEMPGPQFSAGLGQIARLAALPSPAQVIASTPTSPGVKPPPPIGPSGGQMVTGAVPGSPVPGQSFHATTHQTSGLPGYPAYDYMAPAGTKVVAPEGGKIFKLSGKSPKAGGPSGGPLGYSIYIQGKSGKKYFITHLDRVGVKVGQSVRQGQQIAVVAAGPASWSSPHAHMGVSG